MLMLFNPPRLKIDAAVSDALAGKKEDTGLYIPQKEKMRGEPLPLKFFLLLPM